MVVLVTGSRSWTDRAIVRKVLEEVYEKHGIFELIHGGAPGLDTIAGEEYFKLTHTHPIIVRPNYDKYYFKQAPKERNSEMVAMLDRARSLGEDVMAFAFKDPKSDTGGTQDCITKIKKAALPLQTFQQSQTQDSR